MADVPISGLAAFGAILAAGDLIPYVDVSDTSQAPTGTTKKTTYTNLFTTPTITGNTTINGDLNVSGDVDGVTLTSASTIVAATTITAQGTGGVFAATGASTSAKYVSLSNTSGEAIFGTEGSAATLVTGSTAYDAVVRGQSGIAFSANDGSNMHARMASTGIMTLNAQLVVSTGGIAITGNSTFSGNVTNGDAFLGRTTVNFTNSAGGFTGTLTNSPVNGNPSKWIPVDDNGTTRFLPAWS